MINIKTYNQWKKRKILIYNFEQPNTIGRNTIETSLHKLAIPVIVYNFYENCTEKWKNDLNEVIGIVFTGSHASVDAPFSPYIPEEIVDNDIPKLGICYGHEVLGKIIGGEIVKTNVDTGDKLDCIADLSLDCILFKGLNDREIVVMKHNHMLRNLPEGVRVIAKTNLTPIAGFELTKLNMWGLQFHPEKNYMHFIYTNFANYCYKLFHPESENV